MSESDRRVVQTELPEEEYERLRSLAEERDLSLKEVLRRAATAFVDANDRPDPDDSFFSFHELVDVEGSEATDARDMDADLYGKGS